MRLPIYPVLILEALAEHPQGYTVTELRRYSHNLFTDQTIRRTLNILVQKGQVTYRLETCSNRQPLKKPSFQRQRKRYYLQQTTPAQIQPAPQTATGSRSR